MNILLLCNKVPYPANDGSSIAMASMIEGLRDNGAQVDVLCFNTTKHYRTPESIDLHKPEGLNLKVLKLDNRVKVKSALRNLFSIQAYQVSRFYNKEFLKALVTGLTHTEYDLVQLEGLSMAVYLADIRKYTKAPVVLRAHNVEYLIWERHIQQERNPFIRNYLKIQNKRLAKFESFVSYEADAIVGITEADLVQFRAMQPGKKSISVPCGVNLKHYPICSGKAEYDLVYLASLDWLPNQQGLKWFLSSVWPVIKQLKPETNLRIGGRHMPKEILAIEDPKIQTEPVVEDMQEFMCSGQVAIVPLLAGSGMRIKILENMALGLCQVTTTVGAEGITVKDGVDILIEDEPKQMAERIVALLNEPEKVRKMGQKAREKVSVAYNNKKLGAQLLRFYKTEVCV